ncbi:MAG: DinB family protein [Planctomycetes bacterium]|nr:DinB family protein [Planctomycetota bacterium]
MTEGDREILDHFVRTRGKTIELLKRVPDDWLRRQADGEEHSLGWLFGHIAHGVDFWMERCMRDPRTLLAVDERDKASILSALEASRDRLVSFFTAEDGAPLGRAFTRVKNNVEETFVGRNRVLYLTQHEAHHRGKIVLALRQWGFSDIPFLPY